MARLNTLLFVCLLALGADAPPETGSSANQPQLGRRLETEWELLFADDISTEEYAKQIDFFKIEVAAVSKNGKIEYISNVSERKPNRRSGTRTADPRAHIGWKKGTLHAADRRLLSKAGINSEGKELWHFLPAELESQLVRLERAYAGRDPNDIKRTRFRLQAKEKSPGYEFVVIEQDPPKPADSPPRSLSPNSTSGS